MPIRTFQNTTSVEIIDRNVRPIQNFQMAVTFVGEPLFHFGSIHFSKMDALKDRLIAAGKKARVADDNFNTLIGRDFAAVTFTSQAEFDAVMQVIHEGKDYPERNLRVQAANLSQEWYDSATAYVQLANKHLSRSKRKTIAVEETRLSSGRIHVDYIFPSAKMMRDFRKDIDSGRIGVHTVERAEPAPAVSGLG